MPFKDLLGLAYIGRRGRMDLMTEGDDEENLDGFEFRVFSLTEGCVISPRALGHKKVRGRCDTTWLIYI